MPTGKALVVTFLDDDPEVVVELLAVSSAGLCMCRTDEGRRFARHRDRLRPVNREADAMFEAKAPDAA